MINFRCRYKCNLYSLRVDLKFGFEACFFYCDFIFVVVFCINCVFNYRVSIIRISTGCTSTDGISTVGISTDKPFYYPARRNEYTLFQTVKKRDFFDEPTGMYLRRV